MNAAHSFSSCIVNASSHDNSGETCFLSHSKAPSKKLLQRSFQRIHNDSLDTLSNAFFHDFSINQGTCRSNTESSRKVTFNLILILPLVQNHHITNLAHQMNTYLLTLIPILHGKVRILTTLSVIMSSNRSYFINQQAHILVNPNALTSGSTLCLAGCQT